MDSENKRAEQEAAMDTVRLSKDRIRRAFDLIHSGNSATMLSLGEMEALCLRALDGEFDSRKQ